MRHKVTCFTSVTLAFLMAASPVLGSSATVFASEPSDDTAAIRVEPASEEDNLSENEIVIETEEVDNEITVTDENQMYASVVTGEVEDSAITVEKDYHAGDFVPVHVTAGNTEDTDREFRLYFWDYEEELPEDKSRWSEVLTQASDGLTIMEFEDTETFSVDLRHSDAVVPSNVVFVEEEDENGNMSASYLSVSIPSGSNLDAVFHVCTASAKTVTMVPVFGAGTEDEFVGDAAAAVWMDNEVVVEDVPAEDMEREEAADQIVIETEEPADSFISVYAGDTSEETDTTGNTEGVVNVSGLNTSDFASMRLVVMADDPSVIANQSDVIGQYGNVYLLQFTSIQQTMNAYVYYKDKVQAVEPDMVVETASGADDADAGIETSDVLVNEKVNPFIALNELEDSEKAQGSQGVIALIDTGVKERDNVLDRVSVVDDILEGNGHGDAMVDAIVSQDANAEILSVRVTDDNGHGTISSLVAAMEYVIKQKVAVINLSLYAKSTWMTSVLKEEILKAMDAGILVVGSAGNDNADVAGYMPGNVEEAYIIGAANEEGVRQPFSNFGETVDYHVAAESTSEAAALFTGYVSANGVEAVDGALNQGLIYPTDIASSSATEEDTDDSHIVSSEEVTSFNSVVDDVESSSDTEESILDPVTEQYVLENANSAYTRADKIELANMLTVKNTFADSNYLAKDATIDDLMNSENLAKAFITMTTGLVAVYNLDDDSDYLVAFANTLYNDETSTVTDVIFAYDNNNGEVIDDCYYDAATGLVYISKKYYDDGYGGNILGNVQVQLLQYQETNPTDITTPVTTTTVEDDEVVDTTEAEVNPFTFETTVKTEKNLQEEEMLVSVNGLVIDDDSYTYDADKGELTINSSSASVQTVSVEAKEETLVSKAKEMFEPVTVQAATPDTWAVMGEVELKQNAYVGYYETFSAYYAYGGGGWLGAYATSNLQETANLIAYGGGLNWSNISTHEADGLFPVLVHLRMSSPNIKLFNYISSPNDQIRLLCAHISNPIGSAGLGPVGGQWGWITSALRVLSMGTDSNGRDYLICGLLTQTTHTQAGVGFFKVYVKPRTGEVSMKKESALPNITNGNACYSLEGAKYGVYSNTACTDLKATLTTKADGSSNVVELEAGTYYWKELSASPGYEVYNPPNIADRTITVTAGGKTSFTAKEPPGNDPSGIEITKIWDGDKTSTIPTLEGTQFTIKYYDGYYTTDSLPPTPKRTWVFEIKYEESIDKYMLYFDDYYLVNALSDELYRDGSGLPCLPYGTITIQETKPAVGYTLDGYLTNEDGDTISTDSELYVAQVNKDDGVIQLQGGNEFTGYNTPIYGEIKIKKYDFDGSTPLEGVTFQCIGDVVGEIGSVTTDENGEAVFSDLYPDRYTITEVKTVDGHTLLAEPIIVDVPMRVDEEYIDGYNIEVSEENGVRYDPVDNIYYIHNFTYEITNDVTLQMPMAGGLTDVKVFIPLLAGTGILGGIGVLTLRKKRKV